MHAHIIKAHIKIFPLKLSRQLQNDQLKPPSTATAMTSSTSQTQLASSDLQAIAANEGDEEEAAQQTDATADEVDEVMDEEEQEMLDEFDAEDEIVDELAQPSQQNHPRSSLSKNISLTKPTPNYLLTQVFIHFYLIF